MDPDGIQNKEWWLWWRPIGNYCPAVVRVVKGVVVSQFRVLRHKNIVIASVAPRTKHECAGAGQLQIIRPDQTRVVVSSQVPASEDRSCWTWKQQIESPFLKAATKQWICEDIAVTICSYEYQVFSKFSKLSNSCVWHTWQYHDRVIGRKEGKWWISISVVICSLVIGCFYYTIMAVMQTFEMKTI
jgi:hypothetical protein